MKFGRFVKILVAIIVVGAIGVGIAMFNDYQSQQKTNAVIEEIKNKKASTAEKIQAIIDSTVTVKKEELPKGLKTSTPPADELDISDIVNNAIDETVSSPEPTEEAGFSDIEALTSDTFKCLYNGEEKTFRLIGVKSNGDVEGLQKLLDSAEKLTVEYDTIKKNDDGVHLIYLWDGEQDKACMNMINMQIILNKYAETTYMLTSDSIQETPNIKYSTTFIKYQKLANT